MPRTSDVEQALGMLIGASDAIADLDDSNCRILHSSPRHRELLRLEAAINNLTQGLSFFDGDQQLIVCNQRFLEMYDLNPARVRPGIALSKIVDMQYESRSCPKMSKKDYLAWHGNAGNAGGVADTVHELADGRVFLVHYRPIADGAWVATHDDITERRNSASASRSAPSCCGQSSTTQGFTDTPDEVLSFIATHITDNVRELEGALIRVAAYASLTRIPATEDLAREVLADNLRTKCSRVITPQVILEETAKMFGRTCHSA